MRSVFKNFINYLGCYEEVCLVYFIDGRGNYIEICLRVVFWEGYEGDM